VYIQEISIQIETAIDKDYIVDEFGMLISHYRGSGQTQGRIESQYINNNKIICLPFTLETDSLDSKYNNFYVNRKKGEVEQLCNSKIQFKTVGKSYESYQQPCTCKNSSFYILITNFLSISSPINCGDCNKPVPLYKLPQYHDYGYMLILSWETNYRCCDNLQMNCEVGERWALSQMQKVNSTLSKQGLKICNNIEAQTGKPVYYFLFNYKKYKTGQPAVCPVCGDRWGLKQQLHNFYDFKCDRCKLVSTISPNI